MMDTISARGSLTAVVSGVRDPSARQSHNAPTRDALIHAMTALSAFLFPIDGRVRSDRSLDRYSI